LIPSGSFIKIIYPITADALKLLHVRELCAVVGFVPPPLNALKMSLELHEPDNLRTFVPSPIKECFLQFISGDCAGRLLEIQSSGFLTNESSAPLSWT
jgi:hypothetical protein